MLCVVDCLCCLMLVCAERYCVWFMVWVLCSVVLVGGIVCVVGVYGSMCIMCCMRVVVGCCVCV